MAATASGAALVTGAGMRIGRALALRLAQEGYAVAVHYHQSREAADAVVKEITASGKRAAAVQADLSQESQTAGLIAKAQEAVGDLTLLVNSAAVFETDDIATLTRESWDRHLEINLRAPVKLSQDFAAQIDPNRNNVIVNIIDQRVLKLTPQFLSYTVSKAALYTVTKTMAQALAPLGVRVNAIGPGPVLKNDRQSETDWRRQNEATLLGAGANLQDIGDALLYLLRAEAVTGQMIAVDGGQHLAWQTPDVLVRE